MIELIFAGVIYASLYLDMISPMVLTIDTLARVLEGVPPSVLLLLVLAPIAWWAGRE